MKTNYTSQASVFVTKGRQLLKQYDGDKIYLKKGDEFELELFNPTKSKILAGINLNGKSLGTTGLILRPGERVFLERYFDEAKKFLFDTYEVDANNAAVDKAIAENGLVEVEFFEQYVAPPTYNYRFATRTYNSSPSWNPIYDQGIGTPLYRSTTSDSNGELRSRGYVDSTPCSADSVNNFYCCSAQDSVASMSLDMQNISAKVKETGTVEKGSRSDQDFVYDSTTFNAQPTWKQRWTILPESTKAYVKEDLTVYCTNCGGRRKKSSFKFCPLCGQAY